VLTVRGHSLRRVTIPLPRSSSPVVVKVVAYTNRGRRQVSTRVYRGCHKTRRRNRR
jgi:hypothetical protein